MKKFFNLLTLLLASLSVLSCHPPTQSSANFQLVSSSDSTNLLSFAICDCEQGGNNGCTDPKLSKFSFKIAKLTLNYTGNKIFQPEYFRLKLTGNNISPVNKDIDTSKLYLSWSSSPTSQGEAGPVVITTAANCGFRTGGIALLDENKATFLTAVITVVASETDDAGNSETLSSSATVELKYNPIE